MLVFTASSRTSILAVIWAFPTSPWIRAPRSKRRLSTPSWRSRRRNRGQKSAAADCRDRRQQHPWLVRPVLVQWANNYLAGLAPSGSFAKGTAICSGTDIDLFLSLRAPLRRIL